MTLNQLFVFRPVPGFAATGRRSAGLYLCGSAAHPGGGVMGTPGLNAARVILGKRRLRASGDRAGAAVPYSYCNDSSFFFFFFFFSRPNKRSIWPA